MDASKLHWFIALQMVPLVGPKHAKELIAYCGGAEEVFREKKAHLEKIPGIGTKITENILTFKAFEEAEKEISYITRNNIRAFCYLDDGYPARLVDVEDAPILLYFKGKGEVNVPKVLGFVGTRSATNYGRKICTQLIEELKEYDVTIVSGLAYGIDSFAHKAALDNDLPTIAVLGHGLDRIYPPDHTSLARNMLEKGGLISEFTSKIKPEAANFPMRNRIIAGMVDGLVLVETKKRGGALITAEIAYSYNREVFAVPGRVDDEMSTGCNNYIKLNKAYLVENASDIAFHLGWDLSTHKTQKAKLDMGILNDSEKKLVNLLKETEKIHIDRISQVMESQPSELSLLLLDLEFRGYIQCLPGKLYKLS